MRQILTMISKEIDAMKQNPKMEAYLLGLMHASSLIRDKYLHDEPIHMQRGEKQG